MWSNGLIKKKVKKKIKRAKSGAESHGKINVDRLVEMWRDGSTVYAISKHFGVEISSVQYWISKLGLKSVGKSSDNASTQQEKGESHE